MAKKLIDNNTGRVLQLADVQVQEIQDLVDQGEIWGSQLATAQKILKDTNEDIQITKTEYADILSILQQTLNVSQNIGTTIGGAADNLQSIAKTLSYSISLLSRGDSVVKNVLRSSYQLQTIADKIQSIRIEGDPWKLKDATRVSQELARIEQSLVRQGERLGVRIAGDVASPDIRKSILQEANQKSGWTNTILKELQEAAKGSGVFTLPRRGLKQVEKIPELENILKNKGGEKDVKKGIFTLDLNALTGPEKGELIRQVKDLKTEFSSLSAALIDLTEIEKLKEENRNEREISELTSKVVGPENNKASTLAKLANRFGLGDVAELIQTTDVQATKAAKISLTTNPDDPAAARKAYKDVYDLADIQNKLKQSVVDTYLHLGKWGGPLGVALILATAIWKTLLNFDKQAVETKRVIGQWADATAVANFKFVTGTEVLKTMVQLGQQFKINPVQVFSPEELARITRAQKFTGMTAEAAGNLATQSKISGKNADTYRDAIAKGASSANALNHSATNLSAVQNDVLTTSRAIALSYGNSTEALARASGAAAALGMNLQDVENISKNLMNFQTSIESEMQAQLLTGMQLNLAKAREYALNNNLEGVAREIKNQGMDAAKFSHMNYIQQDNMAKALGMSREQMSKMLIMQEINRGLTADQVAAMTNMRKEDIEALSAQEKWQTMKQKFLESLVPLLEPVLQILTDIMRWISPIVGAVGWLAKQISTFGGLIKEDNILLRAIPTILAIALVSGLKFLGVFKKIGTFVKGIGSGIAGWAGGLTKASQSAQAAGIVFDQRLNHGRGGWRGAGGRIVKAPTSLGKSFSSLGKNAGDILRGAAAMAVVSLALIGIAQALRMMQGIEWKTFGMMAASLGVLTAAVILMGLTLSNPVTGGLLLAGAGAMVVVAGAVWILGNALKQVSTVSGNELQSIAAGIRSIAGAIGELAGKLSNLQVNKLNKLARVFRKLKNAQIQVSSLETTGNTEGISESNITEAAKESVEKQVQVQTSAQQISIEQRATDLTRIERKMDVVITEIRRSRPRWDWLEFDHEYALNVPNKGVK